MASVIDNLNLDPALKARLKSQAQQHGRTVDQEACSILTKSLATVKPSSDELSEETGLATKIRALFIEAGEFDLPEVPRDDMGPEPIDFDK